MMKVVRISVNNMQFLITQPNNFVERLNRPAEQCTTFDASNIFVNIINNRANPISNDR